MITSISKVFQGKKLGKRILSGAIAVNLIFATLLGDVNIAYAQVGDTTITEENNIITNETGIAADDGINDNLQDVVKDENVEVEIPEIEIEEGPEKSEDVTEEKEPKEIESENMPAISIVETVEDYEISLECSEGTFAEGTTVEVKILDAEEEEEVDKLVEDVITEDVNIVKSVTFDITFYDKDGNVVEPADENTVSVKIVPSEQDKEELENIEVSDDEELLCSVFHIEDDENVEEIDCEVIDPVEEIIFDAESFSLYKIIWYTKGDEGPVEAGEGPDYIGGFIKSSHTFDEFDLPLEFLNEGSPVDTTLRPENLKFKIYGQDTTGGAEIDHEKVLICEVSVPIASYYNPSSKTISLKKSGESKTEIPVYVVTGTQGSKHPVTGGDGKHRMEGFEYTVELEVPAGSIYTEKVKSTGVTITTILNEAEWSGKGSQPLKAERQTLSSEKFYVRWVDNRNQAGKRPFSKNDDFESEAKKTEFKGLIKLYRQVGNGSIELVEDGKNMLPVPLAEAGPIVGRKAGTSISDWEITYKNLPTAEGGESIKYYITVDDSSFSNNYTAVMPEGNVSFTEDGKRKTAFLSNTTAKYIYSKDFTATVKWYDNNDEHGARLTESKLITEFEITDDTGKKILFTDTDGKIKFDGKTIEEPEISKIIRITQNPQEDGKVVEWKVNVGPLAMYNEQGDERSYKLVLKDGVIKNAGSDGTYEYSVDYSNGTKTTVHNYCLSEGTVIIVIDRPLNSFHVTKEWADNNDQARRKEAIESGVRFLLWRYTDTPEKRAAVFNPETHLQYSYTLKTTDPDVVDTATGDVKSPIVINLEKFGVTEDNPVDMFDQNGVKYVYFATEVISKPGYKTKYDNQDAFKEYSEYGVMNEGTMKNVRQEKMKMEGIVKWNVPSVNDYTKTTVTIELQMLDGAEWKTLHLVEGDSAYTKTLSGFTVTNPKKSYVFPEVERYDSNGNEIKYRIVQTKVSYPEKEDKLLTYTSEDGSDDKKFTSNPFKINDDKYYRASVVPTLDATDSYTIENRLDGDMELVLTKLWEDSGSKGFGKTTSYKNITIKVFQHGTSANYSEPYMTITTGGAYGEDRKGEYFKSHGIEINIDESGNETEKDIPYTITYRAKPGEAPKTETGVIRVPNTDEYRYGDGRAKKWEFKKISGETLSNISLPAFNDNGNAYSYTIEEENVEHAYTTYSYVRTGNELKANVNNKYTEGGGSARTITFQKEWIDGTDIPQEKPIRIAIVRIDEEGKINLKDKLGDEHIVKISENNNWYSQYVLDPEGRFDSEGEGASKRYLYTAIELDMALNGTTDFSRGVTYSDILEDLEKDIDGTKKCTEIKGSIDAYLDTSYEENHLPGYDVTVKATDSVFDARKYVVENKRKGKVNVVFDKNWHDGSNSEGTRTGKYRVYLYQNGKKVVNSASPIDPEKEVCIEGFTESPAEKEYLADNQGKDENKTSFSFEDLPQYDKDGNIYHYSVKEFLVKEDKEGVEKEFEIALTDTKDSSKTGYVVTNHSEKTEFSVDNDTDKTTLWRNDTYEYTNTITGEKTGGVKFYVLWHDQTSYDNGDRPDVNYVLYYKTKNSNQDPQIYKGEYKVEWHPMYDDNAYDNPLKASRYYQYVNFTKLPLANDEGEPYEYYAVPSLNNPGEHYREEYYAEYTVKKAIDETTGNTILTDAGKYHYDIEGTQLAKTDGKPVMLPEDGIVEYTIYDYINVEGIKNWKLDDSGQFDEKKLPDAEIYLWQENRHYKQNSKDNPDGSFLKKTELNENKMGYAFKEKKEGEENYTYIDFPKYDNYGLTYNYSVSEKIYVKSADPNVKYSIPSYVMKYQEDTNGITNVYNPKDEVGNLRKITVTKDWKKLDGETKSQLELGTEEQWPVAEFGLYRVEIPLYDDYYNLEGPESEKTLSPNPTYKAYDYAIHEFKKFKKIEDGDSTIEDLQKLKKSIAYGATESSAVWEDLPIFSPRGLVYLYFVEELEEHGMDSYDYDVIKAGAGARPSVSVFNEVTTGSDRTNVLIEENDKAKVRAVLFSNHGLAPSVEEDDARNCQEAGYENTFKSEQFGKIIGYKEWTDGIFKNDVRPKIVDKECSEVQLTLTRSAVTQKEHGNQVTSVPVPSTDYKVEWFDEGGNRWRFEITPTDTAKEKEFKLYATNGQPYKYTVTERINGTTLRNYTIANSTLTGTKDKVNDRKEMILPSSLQNKLKGEIKVFKKWDDALNELGLRPEYVKVLLQYRIVPNGDSVGEINYATISQWQDYIDSKSGKREYQLVYKNKWAQSIRELPVYATINGAKYRYEYRLLETEFAYMTSTDDETIVRPIDINDHGNVPNGGFCTDATHDVDRENIYGNSKSTDLNYHNKCYEIEVGSYHVNNSAIARLKDNTTNVSSIDLQVDNKLSNTASLKIEKRWDGVNVSEGLITPVDTYGVLPEFLTFYIEYKKEDDSEDKWTILKDVSGAPVSVQLRNTDDGYVDTIVNQLHRVTGEGDILIYRAIESDENLGRFELSGVDKPKYEYDPEVFDVDRTVCHTIVTNTLKSRDITISKRWNAEKDLRKNVTVELWSNNFTTQDDGFKQVQNTSQLLSESNGWEFTYKNLPIFNTEHQPIQYYVVEASVEGAELNDYAIYFFDQTSQTDYEEVIGSSDDPNIAPNIAPIPNTAYKMYIVNTPKTSLKVTKNWDDEDNRQGIREEVTVTLENDGEFGVSPQAEQELTTEKDSSVEWKYLPIYKKPNPDFVKSNKEHTDNVDYTIIEASIEKYNDPEYSFGDKKHTSDNGYTINLSGSGNEATITNTHNPYRIKFTATKKWDDENNRHFSRPVQKGIYLTLYYSTDNKNWYKVMNPPDDYVGGNYPDGTSVYTISNVTQHITNNGTNTWGEGVWEGLPTRVAGKTKLYYKAFETKENGDRKVTPGYSATYTPSSIEVYSKAAGSTVKQEVTNTLNRTSILVSKEWKETYDVIDRPDTVSFVIEYKCGIMDSWKVYKDKNGSVLKVNLTGSDLKIGTTHTWEKKIDNLPSMNSEGTSYEYRVKEVSVAYNGSDEIPAYGVLSDDVSTSIFTQDGKKWTSESTVGAFKDSVVTESYKGSGYSYKVTAVNEPITGKLTVVKKWDDECNRDNLRPEEIRLQLYRKQDQATPVLYGEAVVIGPNVPGTTEINNNEWSYTFDKLPVYNNDSYEHTDENKSIYYVKEVDPKHGYDVTYTTETVDSTNKFNEAHNILKHNVSDNTYSASEVITNKYEPLRIKIKAHKEWEDDNNKQNTRPDSLKFKLQYHIVDENDENTPVVWRDVESVSSQSDLDKTGEKVETTSVLTKTLTKEKNDVITPVSVWDKDENGEAIIWENLPAYVNNGQSVQYRILEYDISKNSDLYRVKYDHCEYENEYGTEDYYTLKALNVLKDMYGELTVEKKWNPEKRDDIANNDKIISEIKCHLEQKLPGEEWQVLSGWGEFSLSHSENWQHTLVHKLTALAEYKVVEDAIVYKDGETISRVLDSDGIARIGSFICSEIPDVVKANSDTADMNVTITNTVPNKSITVNKVWLDENNRDGKRPHSIKVRLKRDGKPVGEDVTLYPKTDAVGSEWYDHEWKNLPVYKNGYLENGELVKSKYTVEEVAAEFSDAYETTYTYSINGGTPSTPTKDVKEIEFEADKQDEIVSVVITNLHETHKETITASKIWEDEENKYNTRPKKTFGDYHTYFMLLYKLDDTPTAKWAPVRHYSADFEKNGCQYPDHHIYTTSPVIQEVSGSEIEEWKNVAIWENVSTKGVDDTVDDYALAAEYDKNVSFMVIEVPDSDYHFPDFNSDVEPKSIAPYGYKASKPVTFDPEVEKVKEEHADVTNTLITTSLGVEKFWEDENDKYKTRPEKIQVKLERKLAVNPSDSDNMWNSVDQLGEEDTIIEIDGTNNWTGSFDGLPSCDKYGNEYVYRAVETALIYAGNKSVALNVKSELDDGKTLTAEGGNYNSRMENSTSANPSDPHKFKLVLTNSLKDEGTTSLTVTKEWKDENDRDRLRPGHIQLNLIRDDVKVDTKTISGPSWEECKWDNLPLYKNGYTGILGERSEYTVTEEPVADYEPKIVKSADKLSVTLTNTHVPKKAVIVADKIWTDSGNTYSTRPKEIYLRLLYKYAGEGDSQYRIVPEYSEAEFVKDGMYTSENADGVFTTSKATQKCTGRDDEDWMNAARWENLPLKAKPNSSEYEPMTVMYKVIEVNSLDTDAEVNTSEASAGYEVLDTTIDGNSLNTDVDNNISITNRLVITEFNIKKVFEDEDNKYNTRPDSIDVQILRRIKTSGDGEWKPVKVKGGLLGKDLIVNLTKSEAYSKKLTDLPKYDKDRNEYEYSCLEKDLIFGDKKVSVDNSNIEASYKISGSDAEIKNTLITTSLTVTKIWDDNSNARGARPKKIVFNVEQKETRDIASQIISTLTELFTGKDGYSELKMLKGGKEETVEIVIEGPEFNAYTLEGLPAYSEDGYLYSYRAVETKLVYEDREVMVENETSLYEKPTYQLEAIESDKDSKGNKTYKYNEKVVNKIIPIRHNPGKPKPEDSSPITPVIVNPVPEKPTPKYELVEDTDPEELPQKLTEIIDELIDLPEGEVRKEKITKLYRDIVKIIQEDPAFIDKLDEETADIVIRFLRTGVLGRRRSKLPKTGGVVGSVMALLFASMLIGLGVAIRPDGGSDKKKRHKSGRKA